MTFDLITKRSARHAYVTQGLSLDTTAHRLGPTRRTTWRWKQDAKARGDDWLAPRKRLSQASTSTPLEAAFQRVVGLSKAVAENLDANASIGR